MRQRQQVDFDIPTERLDEMFGPSNDLTVKSWEKMWMQNIVDNLQQYPTPPLLSALAGQVTKHIAVVFGAGPSLRRLKKHAHLINPDWGLLVTDHALEAVLHCGLKPTLVITMDGDQRNVDSYGAAILRGFDLLAEKFPETPVIADLVTCPEVVERLKNPFFFRTGGHTEHVISRYLQREIPNLPMVGHGGNVGSVCCIFAKYFCYSRHVALIGMDCAMQEGTSRKGYYYDNSDMPDRHVYVNVVDIYGRPITTMANLHNYKWWLEHFCFQNDSVEWINANDGGFLGVHGPAANYKHYKYMSLPQALEYLQQHGEDD